MRGVVRGRSEADLVPTGLIALLIETAYLADYAARGRDGLVDRRRCVFGQYLSERHADELTLVHSRVRDNQVGILAAQGDVSVQEYVDVDRAGTPVLFADSPELVFDPPTFGEQLLRRK